MNHEQIRANMIAAEAWPEGTTPDEKALRRLLAHAYGITYGDDGELQNSAEMPWIDFKRDPVEVIAGKIHKRALARMAREQNARGGGNCPGFYREREPYTGELGMADKQCGRGLGHPGPCGASSQREGIDK